MQGRQSFFVLSRSHTLIALDSPSGVRISWGGAVGAVGNETIDGYFWSNTHPAVRIYWEDKIRAAVNGPGVLRVLYSRSETMGRRKT